MKESIAILAAAAALAFAGANAVQAAPPTSVPPSGSSCGAFYGSTVADNARAGILSGEVNPGVLHQGLADAEDFAGFSCP